MFYSKPKHDQIHGGFTHHVIVLKTQFYSLKYTKIGLLQYWTNHGNVTITDLKDKIGGLGCCPFWGGGSVLVDLLFDLFPVVCGSSVFVFCFAMHYFVSILVLQSP